MIDILENEQIDDLQYKGYKLIQKKDGFKFGLDAVILSNFSDVKKNSRVIDLGTGTGIIAVLTAIKSQAKSVFGLEIQEELAMMAERSVQLNNLTNKITIVRGDIKEASSIFGCSEFDEVISNPPYISYGKGLLNPNDTKALSRHEIMCTLEDVVREASKLLSPGGRFSMVHKPSRLAEIIYIMKQYKIEPKIMRLVQPYFGRRPNLVLIKGIKGSNQEINVLEPLIIFDEHGKYTEEIDKIYSRNED
jgi:tRNA1Val (adenine37-N6)-methyltransferase